jgi:general secretion pathway protein J
MNKNGFTLVEMLVALFVFALIAAAGVSLLSVSVRSQDLVIRRLEYGKQSGHVASLLGQDLAQSQARPWRGQNGERHAAFSGGDGDDAILLTYVRAAPQGRLAGGQRIEIHKDADKLIRISFAPIDGNARGSSSVLLEGVSHVRLRYRNKGEWSQTWQPSDFRQLPDAVELRTSAARGEIRYLFLVGAGA